MSAPVLSVVIPAYNEEENVRDAAARTIAALTGAGLPDFEILFVDDGSTDSTREVLRDLARREPRVRFVAFSRNFGHQAALAAGLARSRGRAVAILDADLQDPPEILPRLLERWREGYHVVYGVRRKRKENFAKRAAYRLFYRLLARLSDLEIPRDSGDFCVMDRRIVDLLGRLPERARFLRGLRAWVGFRQIGVEYERAARSAGRPKYSWRTLYSLGAAGIVGFSVKPLRIATKVGFVFATLALLTAAVYLVRWIVQGATWPRGFASLFIGLCFLFGVQFLLLGILGEYVGSIHAEVMHRPDYIEEELVGFSGDGEEGPGPGRPEVPPASS